MAQRERRAYTDEAGKKHYDMDPMGNLKKIADPQAEYDRNYKLAGYRSCYGLRIAIENKKGSYRKGQDPNGKPWKVKMNYDYGRIVGTEASDSEAVDVYVGDDDTADKVYVIHQNDPFHGGIYDEDKIFLYFPSRESAIEGYMSQYNRPDFFGSLSEFSIPDFKIALKEKKGNKLYRSPIMYEDNMRKNKPKYIVRKR